MKQWHNTYEIYRDGLFRTITFKQANSGKSYETIEMVMHQSLTDENGKVVTNTNHSLFFTPKEFKEFFAPIVNDLKVRFENDNTNKTSEQVTWN